MHLDDAGVELWRECRDRRIAVEARRDDNVLRCKPPLPAFDEVAPVHLREPVDLCRAQHRKLEPLRVCLQVIRRLARRRVGPRPRRERDPRQPVESGGSEKAKRAPRARPPGAADARIRIEDHERPLSLLQVVADCETGLTAADHDCLHVRRSGAIPRAVDGCLLCRHDFLQRLLALHTTLRRSRRRRIAWISQLARRRAWSFLTMRESHTRSCSNANAPAAVREGTSSFARMFCTWRAAVCSLITSVDAISRLLFPVAISLRTSSSRCVSPCAEVVAPRVSESTCATSGAAPSCSNVSRAAASSSTNASSSPRARHACATSIRIRAVSYGASSVCHAWDACRSVTRARIASPSASSTAPRTDETIARSMSVP